MSSLRDYLEALLIAVILATFARTYVVQAFKIPSRSMEENLLVGDHILVNKFLFGATPEGAAAPEVRWPFAHREVRRGDVVVFRFPGDPTRDFIKRAVAVGGDRIEIRDKKLFVNEQAIEEGGYVFHKDERIYPRSIFLDEEYRFRDNFGPLQVPDDQIFVMGDNRDESHDSRFWGTVPKDFVKGRALAVYWSFDSRHDGEVWRGYGHRFRQLAEVMVHFPVRTRWNRTLRPIR